MTHIQLGVVSAAVFALSLLGSGAPAQDPTPASRLPVHPSSAVPQTRSRNRAFRCPPWRPTPLNATR